MGRQLDDAEVRQFLTHGTRTGKLAWTGADGQPHVAPVWFVVDDDADGLEIVFNTGASTAKGRALVRDPRVSMCVDDESPPYAFVKVTGSVTLSDDLADVHEWATRIGARYMGADRADEFGARNGVPGELLVRLAPTRVIAEVDVAD